MTMERPGVLEGAVAPVENDKLFGHPEAEAFLAQSYRSGKGHHAILIEGPEGIGKATLAFRFANHVLSHSEPAEAPELLDDPDPASLVTRQLASGASHNLLHLTRPVDEKTGRAKGAITVDEVRRAGKFFGQTSGTGNWRIVIIDPADDLNRNAANAILKILEEPPRRSLFLVLTHAPGKLLPTIRSRCLPLRLKPLESDSMRLALAHLGFDLAGPSADGIIAAASGSVSEALKLINYGGLDIAAAFEDILAGQGPSVRKQMYKLADILSAKDSETIYDFFSSLATGRVMRLARDAAIAGDIHRAERFARLSSSFSERLTISDAYNLDRKQTILSLLDDLKDAL
ncbi:DNA polymerase III subunit delta' [Sinorhizobium americanum]|uniref:DNA polymerase III subunit delta n=1 Tax=Sinorhizobium americanum TaxID=194963 RepID=A0A1L3LMF2_9HYPH|nr:DNA polymerase III subunit delta' [Sinorhizobium americanum]APG84624.1 DNA polymerase III subunit delta' [Sinorhizobium americanum CCGM7]APG91280.1 DNA polymerase III subunit delta' [Sinorhizobium americanum]OAP49450.1 DNA polymerase III subunit delta' [Sinorhizobium americanum]